MKNTKENNFFTNLNNTIYKLSNLTLIVILVVYAVLLGCLYGLVQTNKSYLVVPEYEHVYFNEEINPQISVIGLRTFDEDGCMTLKYSVSVSIYGRINESSTVDPGYTINNFKMSASTVENVKSTDANNIYYFQEQSSYTSPTTHTYTIDNSSIKQNPSIFYTMLEYSKGSNTKVATFKEEIWLQPTQSDIDSMNYYYENNDIAGTTSMNLLNRNDEKFANLQIIASEDSENNKYSGGVKITMEELSYASRHHIDMQTWILTENGEYLPYIGVYSYSSQKSNYVQSSRDIYKQLKPQYICAKIRYYFSENDYEDYFFKQEINQLASSFSTSPVVGKDDINGELPKEKNSKALKVVLGIGTGVVAFALVIVVSYLVVKKKDEKLNETEENPTNDIKKE